MLPNATLFHFAILEMTELKNNQGQAQWIAKELNIDLVRAKISLQRLVRMGYIQIKNGQLFRTTKPLTTTTDIPSSAIRSFHKQNLELAKEKIESIPVELREFTSITTSVSLKKLARVKKLLNEFKFQINQELEGEDASEVYSLSIQLFPLTKVESRVEAKNDSRMSEFELRRNNLDKKSNIHTSGSSTGGWAAQIRSVETSSQYFCIDSTLILSISTSAMTAGSTVCP
jgi:DNA-binding MarR family transcriptional regulator